MALSVASPSTSSSSDPAKRTRNEGGLKRDTHGGSRGDDVPVPIDVNVDVSIYDLDPVDELTSIDVGDPSILIRVGL